MIEVRRSTNRIDDRKFGTIFTTASKLDRLLLPIIDELKGTMIASNLGTDLDREELES